MPRLFPVRWRSRATRSNAAYWGTRWIMLPNPQYGSWNDALIDFDFSLTRPEKLRRKYDMLDIGEQH